MSVMVAVGVVVLQKWLLALKVLAGVGLIYIILRRVDTHRIAELMLDARLAPMMLGFVSVSIAVFSNAYRWREITRCLDEGISAKTAIVGYFESMFFNQILPTGIGGDAVRVIRAYDSGMMAGWALVGVLIDRAFGLIALGVILVLAYAFGGSAIANAPLFPWLALTAAGVVLGAVGAAWLGSFVAGLYLPRWTTPFVSLLTAFFRVLKDRAGIVAISATLVVSSATMTLALLACARSVGVPLGFWDGLIIMQCVLLAALAPISIGGWGVREGALILLFAPLGVGSDQAIAISVLFGLVLTGVGLVVAAIWLMSDYRRVDLADRIGMIRKKSTDGTR